MLTEFKDQTGRVYLCGHCRKTVYICRQCDRGQVYCPACAEAVRRRNTLEAGRRYQKTLRGRFNHRKRSERYRRRAPTARRARGGVGPGLPAGLAAVVVLLARNLQESVTHHGSPGAAEGAELARDPADTISDAAAVQGFECDFCGSCLPLQVRTGPLRRRGRLFRDFGEELRGR
jgi:hypothetical protein